MLFRLIRLGIIFWFRYQRMQGLADVQTQLARGYLLGLQSLRQFIVLLFVLALGIFVFVIAVASLITGLMLYAPWDTETKAIILISFGVLTIAGASMVISYAYSEKRWMKLFGVEKILSHFVSKV